MSFLKQFGRIMTNKHCRIERFCVTFSALAVLLLIIVGSSLKMQHDRGKLNLTQQVIYLSDSQWSRSGQTVKLEKVFRNQNSSRVFLLFKNITGSGSDMATISTNAADYEVFMTGSGNKDKLTNKPNGGFYVFGQTGYMGILISDSTGLDPHLYKITVRMNAELGAEPNAAAQQAARQSGDESFVRFNQIQFVANLAGSEATYASFLDKSDFTLEECYAQTVASDAEAEARKALDDMLISMNEDMIQINNSAAKLAGYNIKVPDLPVAVAGDVMTKDPTLTQDNPSGFDDAMLNNNNSIISTDRYSAGTETGTLECLTPAEASSGGVYFATDFVFPGGYQYNYQDMVIAENTLDGIKPSGRSFGDWVELKTAERQLYADPLSQAAPGRYYLKWYRTDGSEFVYNAAVALEADTQTYNAINEYVSAVSSLYDHKSTYQTDLLYRLLKIEADAENSAVMFSVNAGSSVLTVY